MSYPYQGAPQPPYQPHQAGPVPNSNMAMAIISLVLCCLPTGIAAVVFASQVNTKWMAGDYAGARDSAQKAKTWSIVGFVAGGIVILIYVLVMMAGIAQADMYGEIVR